MAEGRIITLGTVLAKYGSDIVRNVSRNLSEDEAVASRKLLQSIRFNPIKVLGSQFVLEIVMEDYWKSVDEGQKPGTMPDVQKILRWMAHKKIQPAAPRKRLSAIKSFSVTGRLKRKLSKKAFKDRRLLLAEKIAKAIYRKGTIKRFGYKGSEFLTSYLDWTFQERLQQDITESVGKDIEVQIIQSVKQ